MNVVRRFLTAATALTAFAVVAATSDASGGTLVRHEIWGTIVKIQGNQLTVQLRSGHDLSVDDSAALKAGRFSAPLFVGKTVRLEGSYDNRGIFRAVTVAAIPFLEGAASDH